MEGYNWCHDRNVSQFLCSKLLLSLWKSSCMVELDDELKYSFLQFDPAPEEENPCHKTDSRLFPLRRAIFSSADHVER
uniref:Uncharacterized protein n=1 Tax=Ditylenchus dipsaci TaxID=166011 RepID=A0A915DBK2_9BILA